jgi:hypothetical protein
MTETMQAVNTVMDSDSYALVLRTIERNALLDQRDELVAALEGLERVIVELYPGHADPDAEHLNDYIAVWTAVHNARAALAKAGAK